MVYHCVPCNKLLIFFKKSFGESDAGDAPCAYLSLSTIWNTLVSYWFPHTSGKILGTVLATSNDGKCPPHHNILYKDELLKTYSSNLFAEKLRPTADF